MNRILVYLVCDIARNSNSGIYQGKASAASCGIIAKKPEQFGKAMLFPAMVETYAILALLILCAVLEITIMWYYAVGAVVLGLFVGYASMFGFDKFKAAFEKLKSYKEI